MTRKPMSPITLALLLLTLGLATSPLASPQEPATSDTNILTIGSNTLVQTDETPATPEAQAPEPETTSIPLIPLQPATPVTPPLTRNDVVEAARETLTPAMDAVSNRIDALEKRLAAQYEETMNGRFDTITQSIEAQKRETAAAARENTRTILIVAGCFAAAVLFGILLAALILSRSVQRVSEVVIKALPYYPPSPNSNGAATPTPASLPQTTPPPGVEAATTRFIGALEKLEQRIGDLEKTSLPTTPIPPKSFALNQTNGNGNGNGSAATPPSSQPQASQPLEFSIGALNKKQYGDTGNTETDSQALSWIAKGQTLLNQGNAAEALTCFNTALKAGPSNPADVLVKRGLALEKLEKLETAIESYDQAIAADGSLTLAYLYKGAVCNRLQRYREALDCYEKALRCEQKLSDRT
ncbi:MAG: tetratricopeptide repeat protein [Limisphaerales bacterium]